MAENACRNFERMKKERERRRSEIRRGKESRYRI